MGAEQNILQMDIFVWKLLFQVWFKFHWSLQIRVKLTIKSTMVQVIAWHWTGDKPFTRSNTDPDQQHYMMSLGKN